MEKPNLRWNVAGVFMGGVLCGQGSWILVTVLDGRVGSAVANIMAGAMLAFANAAIIIRRTRAADDGSAPPVGLED